MSLLLVLRLFDSAESIYGEYKEFQAVLRRDGRVRWEPGGVFRTMCPIDIRFYPFDEQICELQFGAWSYYTTKMNLTANESDGFGLIQYVICQMTCFIFFKNTE